MKKLLLLLLFVTPIICFSQTSFSSEYTQQCDWNHYEGNWDDCGDAYEYNSLFVMNKDETMFTHTTSEMKSTYYIKSIEYSEEEANKDLYSYEVVSDVGNEYFFIFDFKNKEVRAVSTRGEEEDWYLIIWHIKSIF